MTDLAMYDDSFPPIRLRGHTLLCLQGFSGEGYSLAFVENMAVVHRTLSAHPESLVEVLDSPDAVCGTCPRHYSTGCTLNGDRSEEEIRDQDRVVLRRLGLKVGRRVRWQDLLDRIRAAVSGADLPTICGSCRWLARDLCRQGIDRLRGGAGHPRSQDNLGSSHVAWWWVRGSGSRMINYAP